MCKHDAGDGEVIPIIRAMETPVEGLIKFSDGNWKSFTKADGLKPKRSGIQDAVQNGSIINWGNHIFTHKKGFKVNLPENIPNASDKAKSRKILQAANPDLVPFTWMFGEAGLKFPIVARPSKHFYGHDFHLLSNLDELMVLVSKQDVRTWYFSSYFDKTAEYRFHVGHGKVIAAHRKELADDFHVANNQGDWEYVRWSQIHTGMAKAAIDAVRILGLHYGGVDVMINEDSGEFKVCEVNTNPGIDDSPYMIGKYAAYFEWLIRHEFPSPFEYDSGDFVFTTDQLAS